ncbi:MAG: CHAT domain-containing protein [Coleofasciculus sp. G3-WIS-01]|uniref:CHAT domain-containing protein n=1 Tax=Coleofasciculus sp. G3-WIS-01 TaxID=3069528 RepID=UPI0032F89903
MQCYRFRVQSLLFLTSLLLCLWLNHLPLIAESVPANQLVQQGVELYQAGDFKRAIALWQTALEYYQETQNLTNTAIIRENLARTYQQLGQIEQAIDYWQQVIADYRQLGDRQNLGRNLTELAQAYTTTGQPRNAIALLCGVSDSPTNCQPETALYIARTTEDNQGEAAALGSLGNAHLLTGNYEDAIADLEASLAINHPTYHTSTLNSLGNAYIRKGQSQERYADSAQQRGAKQRASQFRQKALNDYQQAFGYFQQSLELARRSQDQPNQMGALLNLIKLAQHPLISPQIDAAQINQALKEALDLLTQLPDSPNLVYAAIDLANLQPATSTITQKKYQCSPRQLPSQAESLLESAVSIAQRLEDSRSESFALGEFGHFYECQNDYRQALQFTQKARLAADQNRDAQDSLYLWEWQAARLFQVQGNPEQAIAAYQRAIATLTDIRQELLMADSDVRFDFRDRINPLHRDFAQYQLERVERLPVTEAQLEIESALKTIEALQLAELQNYFGNDCLLTPISQESVEQLVGDDTAIFRSIIFNNHTAILLTLPNAPTQLKWINIDSQTLRETVNQFRRGLERRRDLIYDPKPAQNLYDWIIRPFITDLDAAGINTLVFSQDGILRSIPMAALHNGESFLVETYAIATTPSLTLTAPQHLTDESLQVLALGLTAKATVNGQTFPALTNVKSELQQLESLFPGSKTLLDDDFTRDRLQAELNQTVYPILHIATHGQFSAVPEDTFLVTGNNNKLTLKDLETTIRQVSQGADAVDLLALTACQTAVGDERATLGLAGIAVQAGAKTALASLWFIPDASTKTLITEYYHNWSNPGISKAQALSRAQRKLIQAQNSPEINNQYAHPAYWAPFILIGNWR